MTGDRQSGAGELGGDEPGAQSPGEQRLYCEQPGVAVVAMITSFRELFDSASSRLAEMLGPRTSICEIFPFDFTRYYGEEMGPDLLRAFAIFGGVTAEDELKRMKRVGEAIEAEFFHAGTYRRRINLDPGILTTDHLVLASHKYASHRIYLGDGVYAEMELLYQHGDLQPLPWTYPDYRTRVARDFFKTARSSLLVERQTRS